MNDLLKDERYIECMKDVDLAWNEMVKDQNKQHSKALEYISKEELEYINNMYQEEGVGIVFTKVVEESDLDKNYLENEFHNDKFLLREYVDQYTGYFGDDYSGKIWLVLKSGVCLEFDFEC